MGYLPAEFHFFWPIVMIVVGLGGLLTSDREEWLVLPSKKKTAAPAAKTKKASSRKR